MKKRIISMLLAVCMVVACTLAITPAVSAEGETKLVGDIVKGDVGDSVELNIVVDTPNGEVFEVGGFAFTVPVIAGLEITGAYDVINDLELGVVTDKALAEENLYYDENRNLYDYGFGGAYNAELNDGDTILTLKYDIGSFVNTEVLISVYEIYKFDESGYNEEDIAVTVVPGKILTSASATEATGDEVVSDIVDEETKKSNASGLKNKYGLPDTKGNTIITYYSLKAPFNGGRALFDNDAVAKIDSLIEEFENNESGYISTTGSNTSTKHYCNDYDLDRSEITPADAFFKEDFTAFDSRYFTDFASYADRLVFFGSYLNDELDDVDTEYMLEILQSNASDIRTWKQGGLWNVLDGNFDEGVLNALDEFKPIGHQLPTTESGIKGFRIDSEIKYADMVFDDKQVYQSATVDFKAVVYDSNGLPKGARKTMHKVIPAVYKSISSNNGPAIPPSEGYYFSAVTVKGLETAGLAEGDYIVFEVINTVTNCFEAETASDPVYFKYSFDGSVEQLTTAPAEFE